MIIFNIWVAEPEKYALKLPLENAVYQLVRFNFKQRIPVESSEHRRLGSATRIKVFTTKSNYVVEYKVAEPEHGRKLQYYERESSQVTMSTMFEFEIDLQIETTFNK